ncbi:MAG: hypothetical protein RUDDFDWM_000839 [Candidatus Fervidibacterota bacterium]
MLIGVVKNKSKGTTLAHACLIATSTLERMKGLLGTKSLAEGFGMLLIPCRGIHTFFMRYAIDVVFIDAQMRVVNLVQSLQPWRLCAPLKTNASMVLELPAGKIAQTLTAVGDELEVNLIGVK